MIITIQWRSGAEGSPEYTFSAGFDTGVPGLYRAKVVTVTLTT
jgi:hypothetical protein